MATGSCPKAKGLSLLTMIQSRCDYGIGNGWETTIFTFETVVYYEIKKLTNKELWTIYDPIGPRVQIQLHFEKEK